MQALRTIIYVSFTICVTSFALPQSNATKVFWLIGSSFLMVSIGVWVFKSRKNVDQVPQHRSLHRSDLNLPWAEIVSKIARLRLHYLFLLNIALCAFAVSRGQELWVILIAAPFPAAFLFLIGQALVLGRSFTNLGAIDRENAPLRFRANFVVLIVLYLVASALPFTPSSLLPR